MQVADAEAEFRRLLQQSGNALGDLRLAKGLALVLAFYRDSRFEGGEQANPEADMLLYQWGTYDWDGAGETFQIDITRQFIDRCDEDDDSISQLSLRFHFEPDAVNEAFRSGNLWLTDGRGGLPSWSLTVERSGPFRYGADLRPSRVELGWSRV